MGMDRLLPAFMDELEKIAVSLRLSSFRQARKGRRPIRVSTLLKKETAFLPHRSPLRKNKEIKHGPDPDARASEAREGGPAGVTKRQEAEVESGTGLQESGLL